MNIEIFDLKQLLTHFSDIGEKRFSITLDLPALENVMKPIREGREEFSLKHLASIKEDSGFLKWWKMPEISEEELKVFKGAFVNLEPKDNKITSMLFDLFKNIEIVSCILRFIDPKNYGILSPPVENLLNIKGAYQIEKYLNYLNDLEELKDAYGFKHIANVDMALWTLANILNSSWLRFKPMYYEIYENYQNTPNMVKVIMARNSFRQIWMGEPPYIDLAPLFIETDPEMAGMLAGKALEQFIKERCKKCSIKLKAITKRGPEYKKIPKLSDELVRHKDIRDKDSEAIKSWWKTRNDAVHESIIFRNKKELSQIKDDIKTMIEGIKELKKRIEIKSKK